MNGAVTDLQLQQRQQWTIIAMLFGLFIFNFLNFIWPTFDLQQGRVLRIDFFPPHIKGLLGGDLNYIYGRVQDLFLRDMSPYAELDWYPPFTYVFYSWMLLLPFQAVLVLHTFLMWFCCCTTLWMLVTFNQRYGSDASVGEPLHQQLTWLAAMVVFVQMICSYGFQFATERGSNDALVYGMVVAALAILIKKPKSIWWPTILISVASHLKVYPLIYFILLIMQHGWRAIVPMLVINVAMLFSLGWSDAVGFLRGILIGSEAFGRRWLGNHSALPFVEHVLRPPKESVGFWLAVARLLPISAWLLGLYWAWRRLRREQGLFYVFLLSVPLTNILPALSHDYKLVIVYSLAAVVLGGVAADFVRFGTKMSAVVMLLMIVVTGMLSRSYAVSETTFLAHKYPYILIVQLLILLRVCRWVGVADAKNATQLSS